MPLNVTLDLPADLEEKLRRETPNLDADVKEAYAVELFRRGRLSHYELSRVLGLIASKPTPGSTGTRSSRAR